MGCGAISAKKKKTIRFKQRNQISIKSFTKISKSFNKDQYKFIRKLGEGSFATVYLCLNKTTNKKSAIKVIEKIKLSKDLKDKLQKNMEVAILSSLDHPNIIKCYEVFEDKERIVISEEFIPGGNLFEYCCARQFKLPENMIASIISQILAGLVYCHDRSIIHRDIKLENIFLELDTEVIIKIGDFGSSIKITPGIQISGLYGSLKYMAPEIFTTTYDEKVDIWSLGILLYILMMKKSPYLSTDDEELKSEVKNFPFSCDCEEVKELPEDIKNFLQGLLQINPEKRFSAKEALNHPWLQKFKKFDQINHSHFAKKFQNITHLNTFQKTIAIYVNSFLTDYRSVKDYFKYFKLVDKDGNGTIDKKELIEELKLSLNDKKSAKLAEEFFNQFDLNYNGVIDFMEFITAFCNIDSVFNETNLRNVFNSVDKLGKGFITPFEIENFFEVDFEFLIKDLKNPHKIGDKINLEDFKDILIDLP